MKCAIHLFIYLFEVTLESFFLQKLQPITFASLSPPETKLHVNYVYACYIATNISRENQPTAQINIIMSYLCDNTISLQNRNYLTRWLIMANFNEFVQYHSYI